MMVKRVVFGLYKYVLKEKRTINNLAVFPGSEDTEAFAIPMGEYWWEDRERYIDERYIRVEEYIDKVKENCGK